MESKPGFVFLNEWNYKIKEIIPQIITLWLKCHFYFPEITCKYLLVISSFEVFDFHHQWHSLALTVVPVVLSTNGQLENICFGQPLKGWTDQINFISLLITNCVHAILRSSRASTGCCGRGSGCFVSLKFVCSSYH